MSEKPQGPSPKFLLALVMGGMVLWGAYVALGAYLYDHNPWQGLIVMACVGVFLGIWLLLLWSRRGDP